MKQGFKIRAWVKRVGLLALCALLFSVPGSWTLIPAQAAPAEAPLSNVAVWWDFQLDFTAPSTKIASQQAYSVTPALNRQGVTAYLQAIGNNQFRLDMSGSEGLEQVRQVLYSPDLAGFIGGPAEIVAELPAGRQEVTIQLETNPSTGYSWGLVPEKSSGFVPLGEAAFKTRSSGYGVPSLQTIVLQPGGLQVGEVTLAYQRPFGPVENVTRRLRLHLDSPLAVIDLSNPHPKIIASPSASSNSNSLTNPVTEVNASSALPASLDWRTAGIVPPVRNQGGCASCWAFGTVGIMESAVAKAGGGLHDLSEQFLVSCNTYGWNCANGGLTAHMWHYDTTGKNQQSVGAVLEGDYPYSASDESCSVPYDHPYKLSGWQFVVPSEWMMPTVDQIKQAIATYGPVTAGVCVGSAFQRYRSGIFSTNENCGGWTNHQVILVGWKDTSDTSGYWILRNSWGTWWGENGYMRIAYNTSRVGEGTSWVTFVGPTYDYWLYFPFIQR